MFTNKTTAEEFAENGYIVGMDRVPDSECQRKVTHLYKGTFPDTGLPMCKKGWNRWEDGYSIWRGRISRKGICKDCLKRANAGLDGIEI